MAAANHPFLIYKKEQPTPQCLAGIQRDMAEFHKDPPPGVFIAPEDDDLTTVHAIVMGPLATPSEGGFFHVMLKCPPDYPMTPPRARFVTTDGQRASFSPHIFPNGYICLSCWGHCQGPSWTPAQTTSSLLISIQSMLTDNMNTSGAPSYYFLSGHWGSWHASNVRYDTIRLAVCGTAEGCLRGSTLLPALLRERVIKTFYENYAKYEGLVKNEMTSSGVLSWIGLGKSNDELLKWLRALKQDIEKSKGTATQGESK